MRFRPALILRLLPPVSAAISGDLIAQGRSPFSPPAAAAPAAAAAATPDGLEFRGNIDLGDGVQFRLFDPAKKNGVWLRLNQRNEEFDVVARRYDEEQKALTIEHRGRSITLSMRVAKVVSGGAPAQPPPPVPAPGAPPPAVNVAPAVTQTVVVNPTPADEQRRLEAVAAEVARRRALREQAAQQVNQGVAPTPPATPQAR
ncbi:MAG: hypothetical protein LW690_07185 [Opitutaceae bacterium]|jgi:hypothetical protein|nr:hypothetical protein [Opitutaceae bacterium]